MRRHSTGRTATMMGIALAFLACGDDPAGPSIADVAGSYEATRFITTAGGITTDELAAGAGIDLELEVDGSATGVLLIPGADQGGGDLDVSLDGTWSLSGSTVTLHQTADPLFGNVPLTVVGETLVGDRTFFGTRIQLTLTRR